MIDQTASGVSGCQFAYLPMHPCVCHTCCIWLFRARFRGRLSWVVGKFLRMQTPSVGTLLNKHALSVHVVVMKKPSGRHGRHSKQAVRSLSISCLKRYVSQLM